MFNLPNPYLRGTTVPLDKGSHYSQDSRLVYHPTLNKWLQVLKNKLKSRKTHPLVPKNEWLQVLKKELQVLETSKLVPEKEWLQLLENELQVLENNQLVPENEWLQVLKNELPVIGIKRQYGTTMGGGGSAA